ncbi:MAG: helix-turn-helix transcriptional regulator [Proteobacteria bacterium]|nr:helix-turn-helix transcriptional regulator [Pseudomonadota bacterium]
MKALNSCLGARIAVLRHVAGLSRSQLAAATGRSTCQIRSYETGAAEIGAALVWRISRALDVPVQALFQLGGPQTECRSFLERPDALRTEPAPASGAGDLSLETP